MERSSSLEEPFSSLATDLQNQGVGGSSAGPIGGYDLSFVNDVDDDFKCIVCLDVMRDPYQIIPCGHRFCRTCLDQLIRSANEAKKTPTCPNDRDKISLNQMFPDNNCKRKIICLEVFCKNSRIGCEWHSSLSEFEDHIAKTCLYVETSCSFKGCDSLFLKRQKEEHEANCKWRIVKCDFCSDDFRAFELEEHINTSCPCKPVECPNNGCHVVTLRKMIQHHIDEECLLTPKSCPVEFLGCQEKGTRSAVNKHIVENAYNHIELLCSELKSMNLRLESKNKELAALEQKVKEQEVRSNRAEVVRFVTGKNLFYSYIWSFQLPVTDHYDGFKSVSPTYSTGSHGYFFRIMLELLEIHNGMTQVSLSFQLLPGPHDSILHWPFRLHLSLYSIAKLYPSLKEKRFLAKFGREDCDKNIACFQKPSEDGNPWYDMHQNSLCCDKLKRWNIVKECSPNNTLSIFVEIESYNAEEGFR